MLLRWIRKNDGCLQPFGRFCWDTIWTNGVDFGVGLDVGGTKGGCKLLNWGAGSKKCSPKLPVEVESKKWHETGRRESPEFLDQTVLHEISRRIQP